MQEIISITKQRYFTYSFLSGLFTHFLSIEALNNIKDSNALDGLAEFDSKDFQIALNDLMEEFQILCNDDEKLRQLKIEFENYFLFNFGENIPLWETVYLGRDRSLNSEITHQVRYVYLTQGYVMNEAEEFEDHLSNELAFMSLLCRDSLEDDQVKHDSIISSQIKFLEDHLCRWVPEMVDLTSRTKICRFYKCLIQFTHLFLQVDLEYLKSLSFEK